MEPQPNRAPYKSYVAAYPDGYRIAYCACGWRAMGVDSVYKRLAAHRQEAHSVVKVLSAPSPLGE